MNSPTIAELSSAAIVHAAFVEQGLRRDARLLVVQHPELQAPCARLVQAAECINQLAELLARTISD